MDDKKTITAERAVELVNGVNNGHIFTAIFVKRGNGELRIMNCRKGVKKYVNGTGMKYDPKAKGLLPVFDVQKAKELKAEGKDPKKAYRTISLENLKELHIDKKEYVVE